MTRSHRAYVFSRGIYLFQSFLCDLGTTKREKKVRDCIYGGFLSSCHFFIARFWYILLRILSVSTQTENFYFRFVVSKQKWKSTVKKGFSVNFMYLLVVFWPRVFQLWTNLNWMWHGVFSRYLLILSPSDMLSCLASKTKCSSYPILGQTLNTLFKKLCR